MKSVDGDISGNIDSQDLWGHIDDVVTITTATLGLGSAVGELLYPTVWRASDVVALLTQLLELHFSWDGRAKILEMVHLITPFVHEYAEAMKIVVQGLLVQPPKIAQL